MSAIKNISLYIPHVFPNFDKEYVAKAFKNIGEVSQIDFVAKQDRNGNNFNAVYVHFNKWFTNKKALAFYDSVVDESKEARLCHDEPWYWIVNENVSPEKSKFIQKAEEERFEETQKNSSNIFKEMQMMLDRLEHICAENRREINVLKQENNFEEELEQEEAASWSNQDENS
jgi:hypothetical protein